VSTLGIAVVSGKGGPEFQRELMAAVKTVDSAAKEITSLTSWGRRSALMRILKDHVSDVGTLMLFGHGWPTSLSGFGLQRAHIPAFAEQVKRLGCKKVVLYSCLTASEWLPRKLRKPLKVVPWAVDLSKALPGVEVYAHTTAGHTTRNPYVRRIVDGVSGWLVDPSSPQWEAWRDELHRPASTLRFLFPTFSYTEMNMALALVSGKA